MSLIFKALKKMEAEKERPVGMEIPPVEPIVQGRPKPPLRMVILVVLLCAAAGFLAYTRYRQNKTELPEPQTNVLSAPESQNASVEIERKAAKLFEEERWAESKTLWEELTLISPTDADVYNNLGLTHKKLGQKNLAYQAYQKALALKPKHPQALNNVGVLLLNDGQKQEAKTYFQKALEADPKYADPHFHLAVILEQEGHLKTAVGHYQQFLAQDPSVDEVQKKKVLEIVEALEKK